MRYLVMGLLLLTHLQAQLPQHAFPNRMTDKGVILGSNEIGFTIGKVPDLTFGAGDPWVGYEDGTWWLYYTQGLSTGGPLIWRRHSNISIKGPYSDHEVAIPSTPGVGYQRLRDTNGTETFTACKLPDGTWYMMYMAHDIANHDLIYVATAKTLASPISKLGSVAGADFAWEQGITKPGSEDHMLGEPSVISLPSMLAATYTVQSPYPDGTAVRVGLMYAPAAFQGRSWLKYPTPILVPPKRFNDTNGVNSINHVSIVADPRGGYHMFSIDDGKLPYGSNGGRGISHRFSTDLINWVPNPNNPIILPGDIGSDTYGHIGGPAPYFDFNIGKLYVVYHAQATPGGSVGRHLRLAEVQL